MFNSIEKIQPTLVEQQAYKSLYKLKNKKAQPITIYTQIGEEKIKRVVNGLLGNGGSKRAYELEGGLALLMPAGKSLFHDANLKKWSEMVDEELIGTKRVKELGLLACHLEKTHVFMAPDSDISVPAYLTETFSQLSLKGIWVIDQKNRPSTTWKKSFFHDTTNKFDEKIWEKLLNPF